MQQDVPDDKWFHAYHALNQRIIDLNQKIQELSETLNYHIEYGPHVPEEGIQL